MSREYIQSLIIYKTLFFLSIDEFHMNVKFDFFFSYNFVQLKDLQIKYDTHSYLQDVHAKHLLQVLGRSKHLFLTGIKSTNY